MSMSELRNQNGVGGMSWHADKEGLVDDSGKMLKDIGFSFESPKSSRPLFFFFFSRKPHRPATTSLFSFLILPLLLSYNFSLSP